MPGQSEGILGWPMEFHTPLPTGSLRGWGEEGKVDGVNKLSQRLFIWFGKYLVNEKLWRLNPKHLNMPNSKLGTFQQNLRINADMQSPQSLFQWLRAWLHWKYVYSTDLLNAIFFRAAVIFFIKNFVQRNVQKITWNMFNFQKICQIA